MSRALKLFILAGVVGMTGMLAAFAWVHWDAVSHMAELSGLRRRRLLAVLVGSAFFPIWVGLGGYVVHRQLTQRGLQLADEHRRLTEVAMAVAVVFTLAVQAWIDFGAAHARPADFSFFLRLTLVFCGVFVAVFGNFQAKAAPATGPLAPAPAVWIRGMLRSGWAMVLLGLIQVVVAIVLPFRLLPISFWLLLGANLFGLRSQLRLMWPSSKARPST
jgi:hypothetical protein